MKPEKRHSHFVVNPTAVLDKNTVPSFMPYLVREYSGKSILHSEYWLTTRGRGQTAVTLKLESAQNPIRSS